MTAKATWVDPPSGWKYGFPKLCPADQVHRMSAWIIEQGYPQRERDSYKGEGGDYSSFAAGMMRRLRDD